MKRRSFYMHTLDGQPAEFCDMYDPSIGFAGKSVRRLATSLKQIRKEQAISLATRARLKLDSFADPKRYGYVRIEVPE